MLAGPDRTILFDEAASATRDLTRDSTSLSSILISDASGLGTLDFLKLTPPPLSL